VALLIAVLFLWYAGESLVFFCLQAFGKVLENYFLPGLIVLGLVCGGIAAKTYNEGATTFVKGYVIPVHQSWQL